METICDYLIFDHKRCDALFVQAETSIGKRNWQEAETRFRHFYDALEQHLRMEENVLFPAFGQAMHNADGPLSILRVEHQRIRGILNRMSDALKRLDQIDFLLHAETFTILMQQHSLKEEDMLYPLLDRSAPDKRNRIVHAMREYIESGVDSAVE